MRARPTILPILEIGAIDYIFWDGSNLSKYMPNKSENDTEFGKSVILDIHVL